MYKLINTVQHYAWGSKTALSELYGMANPTQQPMAELWMGAHPKSSSRIVLPGGEVCSLAEVIAADPRHWLGEAVAERFAGLPFLFKVLCADQPLSIQVHPCKAAAQAGFDRENAAGISLEATDRNYKDANHKPELVYALTPFHAMNGFRDYAQISALLKPVAGAHPAIDYFLCQPDADSLRALFAGLLTMKGEEKSQALCVLNAALKTQQGEPWETIRTIARIYPDDGGLFSPLLLNVVTLAPGEAMFLFAETPHAYLHGVALEVMANSDNVLRAGLTPKHIDVAELMANVDFTPKPSAQLLTTPVNETAMQRFPVPVDDFAFSIHTPDDAETQLPCGNVAILLCLEGTIAVRCDEQVLQLGPGDSVIIGAQARSASVSGPGRLARAFAA